MCRRKATFSTPCRKPSKVICRAASLPNSLPSLRGSSSPVQEERRKRVYVRGARSCARSVSARVVCSRRVRRVRRMDFHTRLSSSLLRSSLRP